MEYTGTQEIVVQIKEIAKARNLNASQVKEIVDGTGYILSETVFYRLLKEGSEKNDSFNYEHTLRPILQALVPYHGEDAIAQTRSNAFMAITKYKDEKIAELEQQKEAMRNQFEKRCKEYETRMAFLRDQIELKDQRMDRKDQMIEKLLDQVLTCSHCPVEKER